MQVVIDIDENLYTRLFDNGDTDAVDMLKACVAIRKGTPLQKGHCDVLDKIRAEIAEHADRLSDSLYGDGLRHALDIIDKYKAEKEESHGRTNQ